MVRVEYLDEGDQVLTKIQMEYFNKLIEFQNEHLEEWAKFLGKKKQRGTKSE